MDRVEEIEAAINGLPPDEYRRLAQWFQPLEQTRWDGQLDRDSSAGKLDFLFDEATGESAKRLLLEWLGIPAKANTDSGGNANGIPGRRRTVLGAQRRWPFDWLASVRLRQGKVLYNQRFRKPGLAPWAAC